MRRWLLLVHAGMVLLLLAGCGGGGGASASAPTTAVFSISVQPTAALSFPISTIELSGQLPVGVTPAVGSGSPAVITSGLTPGSALGTNWSGLFAGTYSAGSRNVTIAVAGGNQTFNPGEIARLTCTIAPGTNATTAVAAALESTLSFSASGIDASNFSQPITSLQPVVTVTLN